MTVSMSTAIKFQLKQTNNMSKYFSCKVTDAMMTIIEGEIMNDSSAFVDSLVKDECLKTSRRPVIVHLISSAISEGRYNTTSF